MNNRTSSENTNIKIVILSLFITIIVAAVYILNLDNSFNNRPMMYAKTTSADSIQIEEIDTVSLYQKVLIYVNDVDRITDYNARRAFLDSVVSALDDDVISWDEYKHIEAQYKTIEEQKSKNALKLRLKQVNGLSIAEMNN